MYKVHNGSTFEVQLFVLGSNDAFATLLPDEEVALPLKAVFCKISVNGVFYTCLPIHDTDPLTDRTLLIPADIAGKYLLIREKGTETTVLFTRK